MGQEFGQEREWSEARELDWFLLENPLNKGMQDYVKELLKLYTSNPAMYENDNNWDGFEWINCITPQACMLSYLRKSEKPEETLVVVANFANAKQDFTVGVPFEGKYKEILNTDSEIYGGSDIVNNKEIQTIEKEWDGKPYAIEMVSAPLSLSIFSYTPYTPEEKAEIEKAKAEAIRKAKEEAEKKAAEEVARITALEAQAAKKEAQRAIEEANAKAQAAKEAAKRAIAEADAKAKAADEAAAKLRKINEKRANGVKPSTKSRATKKKV